MISPRLFKRGPFRWNAARAMDTRALGSKWSAPWAISTSSTMLWRRCPLVERTRLSSRTRASLLSSTWTSTSSFSGKARSISWRGSRAYMLSWRRSARASAARCASRLNTPAGKRAAHSRRLGGDGAMARRPRISRDEGNRERQDLRPRAAEPVGITAHDSGFDHPPAQLSAAGPSERQPRTLRGLLRGFQLLRAGRSVEQAIVKEAGS